MLEFIILILLIIINGFFSLSEISLVSSKKTRLEQYKQAGSKGAETALNLLNNSEKFLSSVQVGITLVSLFTGFYGGTSFAQYFTPLFSKIEFLRPYAHEISLVIVIILITYITIVIGELVPKTIAISNPEKFAVRVAPTISLFSKIFYPFVKLLSSSTSFFMKVLGVKKNAEYITESELRQMIKTASDEGVIEEEQNVIHEKVFHFADKRARHLMTHRIEVEWIDIDEPDDEIQKDIDNCQHSKILCCHESLDNFAGILIVRDYYKAKAEGKNIKIEDLMIQPFVIHETTSAQKVLQHLRESDSHFCVVVDEYGDFEGIVTFHDIMENLVGLIPDDGEVHKPDYFIRDDNSVLIDGDAPVEALTQIIDNLNVDFEEIDYSTVAGFIIDQINEIPKTGDKIIYLDHTLEIVDMDGNRIDKVLIKKNEESNAK